MVPALPAGSSFVSARNFGKSAWTITGRIAALDADGTEKFYFVKVSKYSVDIEDCVFTSLIRKIAYGETGRIMLRGEYESSNIIYAVMPDFIPRPLGYGKYKSQSQETYFYLSDFVDMDMTTAPDPAEFTARLARMHQASRSPTGKFGFHVPTCDGDRAHAVDWQESWAVFYRNLFLGVCELDIKQNGPWPEYEHAIHQVAWKVIPRLLEPLQADGRELKPRLIHGDLWEGNMGINKETGHSLLFDAGSYWAHNEMELGHWRCEFSSVFRSTAYTIQYLQNYPAAEPVDEFDDRNRLYSLKGAINYAAGHPGSTLRNT
jgi:fructosamine-3-kinase